MSTPLNLKIDPEKVQETPMVDLAFMILKAANTPYYYRDLMNEVAKLRGMTEEQLQDAIAQLYTEINIDGRFACVGTNLWGLKRWYPIEKSEDPIANASRPRIINDEDDDLDDEDYTDEEEESYSADEEDYDAAEEEDEDALFADEDEDAEVEDESLLDDEDLEEEDLDEESEEEDDLESEEEEDFKD
ncbi:DNA-directed RNA polymerase subunit delta [Paenibacillus pinistramenti]|uniref:DNA-directed RNA polymerase subunit delta n=1 Tax=Paenibacillus pinistramenti TaxID=1768003 RepID=UPI0011081FF4|nr:DNA-directed RNA polymerase subunit delta [Paenibacillus pinistramenti]